MWYNIARKPQSKGISMQIELIKTSELVPYTNNARTHTREQVEQVAASIREFGFTNPVLIDKDNGIIAGHARTLAAFKIGMDEVPCIRLDHLTETQKKAYIIADNKLALNAGWDEDMLLKEIEDLVIEDFDLDLLGFNEEELNHILNLDENTLIIEDEAPEPPEEPISRMGDIWMLGNHKVMCGDSTKPQETNKLLSGNKIDMVFTDPPYNVAFNGRSGKHDVILNDDLSENDFIVFINKIIDVIISINAPIHYIWCNWKFYGVLQGKLPYKSCIVWAKNVFGLGRGYRHQHEFCLFNGKIDEEITNESDLWEIAKDTNYVHPTQKPVALCGRALKNHKEVITVLDLFGGSGSTLIAAEQLKRKCFMMELDPIYVDVIVNRYINFKQSDKDVRLIRNGKEYIYKEILNGSVA